MDYQRLAMNWLKGEFTGTTMFEGENTMVSGSMFQVQSMEAEIVGLFMFIFTYRTNSNYTDSIFFIPQTQRLSQ